MRVPDGIWTHDPPCSRTDALTTEPLGLCGEQGWNVGFWLEPHHAVTQPNDDWHIWLITVSHSHIKAYQRCTTLMILFRSTGNLIAELSCLLFYFKVGHSWLPRCSSLDQSFITGRPLQVLHHCLPAMESLMKCLDMSWMAILVSIYVPKKNAIRVTIMYAISCAEGMCHRMA